MRPGSCPWGPICGRRQRHQQAMVCRKEAGLFPRDQGKLGRA